MKWICIQLFNGKKFYTKTVLNQEGVCIFYCYRIKKKIRTAPSNIKWIYASEDSSFK